jgi:ankyrin repeat protein
MVTVEGGCVLHAAAQGGRQEVLRAALAVGEQIGVSVNQRDSMGRTPLHSAVAAAQPKLIEMLIAAGAATELSTQTGVTPLGLAVELGEHSCVLALLRAGANSDALTAESVPLLLVAAERSVAVALDLLSAGAKPNQPDGAGRTALEVAVERGEYELCERLLGHGATPTRRADASGNTMMHRAVLRSSEPLVRRRGRAVSHETPVAHLPIHPRGCRCVS